MPESRDLIDRPQMCPRCHDRGAYPVGRGSWETCSCPYGTAIRSSDAARARLRRVYSERELTLWMEARIPALGGERPIQLLRDGRVEEVMAVIDRIPGAGARAEEADPPEPVRPAEPDPVPVPVRGQLPEELAQVRRVVVSRLHQAGYRAVADAFASGRTEDLTDRERAVLDAAVTGTGYLLDGEHVAPERVEVLRWR